MLSALPASLQLIVVVLLVLATQGWASSAQVMMDPSTAVILGLGRQAVTRIQVSGVEDLFGYQLELHYDPSVVHAEDLELGDFISSDWVLEDHIDNADGVVVVGVSQRNPTPPRDGSGVLVGIRWKGVSPGTTDLALSEVKLAKPGGERIPVDVRSGQIEVVQQEDLQYTFLPMVVGE